MVLLPKLKLKAIVSFSSNVYGEPPPLALADFVMKTNA